MENMKDHLSVLVAVLGVLSAPGHPHSRPSGGDQHDLQVLQPPPPTYDRQTYWQPVLPAFRPTVPSWYGDHLYSLTPLTPAYMTPGYDDYYQRGMWVQVPVWRWRWQQTTAVWDRWLGCYRYFDGMQNRCYTPQRHTYHYSGCGCGGGWEQAKIYAWVRFWYLAYERAWVRWDGYCYRYWDGLQNRCYRGLGPQPWQPPW